MVKAQDAVIGKAYITPKGMAVTVVSKDPASGLVTLKWATVWGTKGMVCVTGDMELKSGTESTYPTRRKNLWT